MSHVFREFSYNVMVSVSAAAYREGDITLEGKKHHVVLIDFNSNGRFDDEIKIPRTSTWPTGNSIPSRATCCCRSQARQIGCDSPYDPTSSDYRHYVSKLVNIDGRFYDLKISPAGDKLTLTPSDRASGQRDEPERRLPGVDLRRATRVPQDQRHQGQADPVPRASGSCFLHDHARRRRRKPAEKKAEAKEPSSRLAVGRPGPVVRWRPPRAIAAGPSIVAAQATADTRRSRSARARRSSCPSARRTSPW